MGRPDEESGGVEDMPRTTENFVLSLETLYFAPDPKSPTYAGNDAHLWPVFFKIDGATAQVDNSGKLTGTATVSGTAGVGPVCRLQPGDSVAIPAEIGQWSDQVMPIPLPPILSSLGPDMGGIFGVALVALDPGGLETDAVLAGHAAFNDVMQSALNDLITNHPRLQPDVGPDETKILVDAVEGAILQAIQGAMDLLDELHYLLDRPVHADTFAYFSQDEMPVADFDQKDFSPAAAHGPKPFGWRVKTPTVPGISGFVGLNGAISRSRRAIGQGVLRHLDPSVRAVAGFTSSDGFQHAIAATDDGALTEMYWQGSGQVGSGFPTRFNSQIVGLAGYSSADGYQQVIVATDDGTVTEVYWQGPNPPSQGALSHFDSSILAIAGYSSGDGYQHVIVATDDGNLTEVYWLTGAVGRGTLTHLASPVVDLAGDEAGGVHHVIAATTDGTLTELTWNGVAPTVRTLAQVEAQPWNHVLGVGAYEAAQEQHVIVAMSNGTLREFHTPSGDSQAPPQPLHTDLATIPFITPIIDAYTDASGYQHAIVATAYGDVHELWWTLLAGRGWPRRCRRARPAGRRGTGWPARPSGGTGSAPRNHPTADAAPATSKERAWAAGTPGR